MKTKGSKVKKVFKRKLTILLTVFLTVIVIIMVYLNYVVNPIIISTSAAKVRSLSQRAVERAIRDVMYASDIYNSLVLVTRDDKGKIVTISSNSATINSMALQLTEKAQMSLINMGEMGINIPIGTFSGMPILTGRGPAINIKLLPIGTIYAKFNSTFNSAGINQTNHRIYLNVFSSVSMILPTANQVIKTETEIMIAESIIIGEIPETYLNSTSLDEMMNLIP